MKRSIFLLLLGILVLGLAGFACGGGEEKAPAPAAKAKPAAPAPAAPAPAAPAPAAPAPAASTEPIKIAAISYVSGPAKDLGTFTINGVKLALKQLNDQGGAVGGRKFEVHEYDEGYNAETVVASTKKAIADGVAGIVGGIDATTCVPMKDVAKEVLIPLVITTCGSEKVTLEGYPGVVHVRSPVNVKQAPDNALSVLADWMLAKGYKRVAGVGVDSQFVRNTNEEFTRVFNEKAPADFKYLGMLYFPYGTAESRIEVTKAVGQKPDFLYLGLWGKDVVVNAVGAARELGFTGGIMINEYVIGTAEIEALGASGEGVYGSFPWVADPAVPASIEYANAYKAEFGIDADALSEHGYVGGKVLGLAIKNANSTDSAKVRAEIPKLAFTAPDGFPLRFDWKGQRITNEWIIVQIQGGKLVAVDRPKMWQTPCLPLPGPCDKAPGQ